MKKTAKKTSKDYIVPAPDLSALKREHQDKWVALSRDYKRVVDSADSLDELARHTKGQDVLVMKALPMMVTYAPGVFKS
ncbi:MAG TPA: hypothetical protein VI953_02785 [Candidatus Paceibacterota bacterium]